MIPYLLCGIRPNPRFGRWRRRRWNPGDIQGATASNANDFIQVAA